MVRAKFKVETVEPVNEEQTNLALRAVYDDSPENREWWQATPSGYIHLSIVNQAAAQQFRVGQEFYVDFTPISKA